MLPPMLSKPLSVEIPNINVDNIATSTALAHQPSHHADNTKDKSDDNVEDAQDYEGEHHKSVVWPILKKLSQ